MIILLVAIIAGPSCQVFKEKTFRYCENLPASLTDFLVKWGLVAIVHSKHLLNTFLDSGKGVHNLSSCSYEIIG